MGLRIFEMILFFVYAVFFIYMTLRAIKMEKEVKDEIKKDGERYSPSYIMKRYDVELEKLSYKLTAVFCGVLGVLGAYCGSMLLCEVFAGC